MNIQRSENIVIADNEVYVNGEKMPPCPTRGNNSTIINNKVFIDGYELVNGRWKKTLRALWHKYF